MSKANHRDGGPTSVGQIYNYTVGTLSDGSVVLEFALPPRGERWVLRFDESGYERLTVLLAKAKAIAERRKRMQTIQTGMRYRQ